MRVGALFCLPSCRNIVLYCVLCSVCQVPINRQSYPVVFALGTNSEGAGRQAGGHEATHVLRIGQPAENEHQVYRGSVGNEEQ